MSAVPAPPARPMRPPTLPIYPRGSAGGRSTAFWGMVLLIFTEATFFAILLMSYFYLRFQSGPTSDPDAADVYLSSPVRCPLARTSGEHDRWRCR